MNAQTGYGWQPALQRITSFLLAPDRGMHEATANLSTVPAPSSNNAGIAMRVAGMLLQYLGLV